MTAPEAATPTDSDEQLSMVLLHTRVATLVATAFAVMMAFYVHGTLAPEIVERWITVKAAVAALRVALGEFYARRDGCRLPWHRLTYTLLAIDGAVWGAAGFALMQQAEPLAALVAASLAGVACVATFGLQLSLIATACYVVPIMAPTALGLLGRGDEFGSFGGIGLLMLLALTLVTARAAQARFLAGLALRRRAEALAAEKDDALRLAERQAAVKTQFLANISHELRTPLHGILGLARLLHVELRNATHARRVELIESSGTHLLRLINDLLDVSRVESGHFAIRQEPFDLATQALAVADVYAVRAADKGLAFRTVNRIGPGCWVMGDAARVRQVLHNLLGNAIKFTQRGGIEMEIGRGDTADEFRIEVRDSGRGIAPAQLDKIFEPFHLAEGDAPASGAGLGLTIALEIARAMGGTIAVSSEPGAGSTFAFTARLPAVARPPADRDQARECRELPALPPVRQVLVAEDDDVNALIVGAYLDQMGIAHERVDNGKDAVSHALRETERPEAVLMDCRMPVMDGLEATREIRVQEATLGLPRLRIVALTATAADYGRDECFAAGMDGFLSKPFTPGELAQALGTPAPDAR